MEHLKLHLLHSTEADASSPFSERSLSLQDRPPSRQRNLPVHLNSDASLDIPEYKQPGSPDGTRRWAYYSSTPRPLSRHKSPPDAMFLDLPAEPLGEDEDPQPPEPEGRKPPREAAEPPNSFMPLQLPGGHPPPNGAEAAAAAAAPTGGPPPHRSAPPPPHRSPPQGLGGPPPHRSPPPNSGSGEFGRASGDYIGSGEFSEAELQLDIAAMHESLAGSPSAWAAADGPPARPAAAASGWGATDRTADGGVADGPDAYKLAAAPPTTMCTLPTPAAASAGRRRGRGRPPPPRATTTTTTTTARRRRRRSRRRRRRRRRQRWRRCAHRAQQWQRRPSGLARGGRQELRDLWRPE